MEDQLVNSSVNEKNKFLGRTYGWMALALLISAAAAFLGACCQPLMLALWGYNFDTGKVGTPVGFIILSIVEIALVITLSSRIRKLKLGAVIGIFIAYSVVNGLTLSSIFWVYDISSIGYCFVASAVMFGLMSVYGMKTKSDLNKAGKYLMMALIGLVIISLINLMITLVTRTPLTWLDWVLSLATVVIFAGLTAYDSQKILRAADNADEREDFKKLAVYGALELYLDFINIFLALLRLFGKRR